MKGAQLLPWAGGSLLVAGGLALAIRPLGSQGAEAPARVHAPQAVAPGTSDHVAWVPAVPGATYLWTLGNGVLTRGQGTRTITFKASAPGILTLACLVKGPDGRTTLARGTVSVRNGAHTPAVSAPPEASRAYGAPWAADSLMNHPVGGPDHRRASFRFRAQADGRLKTLRVYFVDNADAPGYAAGHGGNLRVELRPDDGTEAHHPADHVLAVLGHQPALREGVAPGGNRTWFPLLTFPKPPTLVAGQLYHVVFSNDHPQAASNWISVNGLVTWNVDQPQPGAPRTDFSVLINHGRGWREEFAVNGKRAVNLPILDLGYTDGTHQGNGYMEVWIGQPRAIAGDQKVRQVFTPEEPQRISGVSVRLKRTAPGGLLRLRLEEAEGRVVASAEVEGAQLPTSGHAWVSATFSTPCELQGGRRYHLVLSAPAGAFVAYPLRDGGEFGFTAPSVFREGWAEFEAGQGWLGWDGWQPGGDPTWRNGDLQFSFTRVE